MKTKQNNVCLICKIQLDSFVVDHDHVSGKVRGILCSQCNIGLGNFMDNPIVLTSAIDYLNNASSS